MNQTERNLLMLLEKPYEDVSRPRGRDRVGYDLTTAKPLRVTTRVSGPVNWVTVPERPDLTVQSLGRATTIRKGGVFSFFVQQHRRAARDLCQLFMKSKDAEDLMQIAAWCKDRVNEGLFNYAFCFTIVHRKDLRSMRLPTVVEMFPNKFVPMEALTKAQVEVNRAPLDQKEPVIIDHGPDFATTTIKAEHRVSYWREDYGLNSHHWHWHLVFPIDMGVNRDRKGELFFFMHSQMLARYDMERLSVGLNRVVKYDNWRAPIDDGYFSKLTVNNSGRAWGTRQDDTVMQDFRRNDFGLDFFTVAEMEQWRSRLLDAIHQGFMVNREGNRVPLSDDVTSGKRGIDILGDAFEADADLSVNSQFYGDLHNLLHVAISFSHDPDFAHKEEVGVMGESATAMRDPVFYRLHRFVDDVFQQYKLTLPPYSMDDLSLPGVVVERAGIRQGDQTDILVTGWSNREFEASRGIDFAAEMSVLLRLQHIDHLPFNYHIMVNNQTGADKQVTVRIFLAPRKNERGDDMSFMDQRLLWAEMDKFTVSLKSGSNHIERMSKDSSITNPNEFTFRDLEQGRSSDPGTPENAEFDFCGCGWPQHLLVPRGKPEGMAYQLFVMITDFEKDKVEQTASDRRCANGVSFCGILDGKYPDKRPMGFPFDRRPPPRVMDSELTKVADLARLDNILLHNITVRFTDEILQK
ncbi:hypothetical protein Pcinc_029357 [Petrolisthes cinctipes]|uniref:Tyrosinase copper-binding domain-containing protein n=1 Tax=Petrolisthes cinctipes TaxID=88211 RepID=A0AAE1F092_PETCI|nr:hypothetical protein Pcinc_029357 [Petrolisthes cinctipes]